MRYKRKLRIELRNDGDGDLIVNPAKWQTRTGDINTLQPLSAEHPWQPKRGRERPGEAVNVRPGGVIKTWVGLAPSADQTDVRQRHETKRLGTLIVQYKIDGRDEVQRIRL